MGRPAPDEAGGPRLSLTQYGAGPPPQAGAPGHSVGPGSGSTLILTGCFVGYLPDHYAQPFAEAGRMRAVPVGELSFECRIACIHRNDLTPTRAAWMLLQALQAAHAGQMPPRSRRLRGAAADRGAMPLQAGR